MGSNPKLPGWTVIRLALGLAAPNTEMPAAPSERFRVNCACAVRDRAFIVTFERPARERLFRIVAIDKVAAAGPGGAAAGNGARTLSSGEISLDGWQCPWCGDEFSFVQCEGCRTAVCAGRVSGRKGEEYYICRDSCGTRGRIVPAPAIKGSDTRPPQAQPASLPGRGVQQALPPQAPGILPKTGR